jgi:hypothetical protein
MDRRGWVSYSGHVPAYGTLGNAFMEIQAIAQPEKTHVLELKEAQKQEKRDDDDAAGPSPPARQGGRTSWVHLRIGSERSSLEPVMAGQIQR